jgi:hypothetical protein
MNRRNLDAIGGSSDVEIINELVDRSDHAARTKPTADQTPYDHRRALALALLLSRQTPRSADFIAHKCGTNATHRGLEASIFRVCGGVGGLPCSFPSLGMSSMSLARGRGEIGRD